MVIENNYLNFAKRKGGLILCSVERTFMERKNKRIFHGRILYRKIKFFVLLLQTLIKLFKCLKKTWNKIQLAKTHFFIKTKADIQKRYQI